METREALIAQTFVELADSLADEFDIVDLLTVLADRCVRLLDASAVGILLSDQQGVLRVVAASTEQAQLLDLFQIQNHEGPCLDCFSSGIPVASADLSAGDMWPKFSQEALAAGFHSVQVLPLRLRELVIGTLTIFAVKSAAMKENDLRIAQALADMATIAIVQNESAKEKGAVLFQLQRALDSRVVIEQAKGMLAERDHIEMPEALIRLRDYARHQNLQLGVGAADLIAELSEAHRSSAPTTTVTLGDIEPTGVEPGRAPRRESDDPC
jgi:transcriptional regulator with GAF, ATPase, and Fis domain